MAEKRMFSMKIVDTDDFLDMPASARLLYYDLGMRADDDGFVDSIKKILRVTSIGIEDLEILEKNGFIIRLTENLIVIKHWRCNNTIRNDRYTKTNHSVELSKLSVNENGCYENNDFSVSATTCQPSDNQAETSFQSENETLETQYSIGLDKNSIGLDKTTTKEQEDADACSSSCEKEKFVDDVVHQFNNAVENDNEESYFNDKELDELFDKFLVMRKELNAPLTSKTAQKHNIERLHELAVGSDGKFDKELCKRIMNKTLESGWKSFFALKEDDYKSKGREPTKKNKNKFNNFPQRNYSKEDTDRLEKMLLGALGG